MAVGNIVGSNLFNILGIAGVAAMVAPLPVADKILNFDIWVMLGVTVLMLPILTGRWRLKRPGAALFLILYGAYIAANGYSAGLFGDGSLAGETVANAQNKSYGCSVKYKQ